MKFTVLIVTYHPDWKKLLVTLDSIMAQTFKDYEIVVSDDGSEENCFDKIEAYFAAHQFATYSLPMRNTKRTNISSTTFCLNFFG